MPDFSANPTLSAATSHAPSVLATRHVHYVGSTTEVEPHLMNLCNVDDTAEDRRYRPNLQRFGNDDTFLVRNEEISHFGHAGLLLAPSNTFQLTRS